MQVIVVGTGKLATELLSSLKMDAGCQVMRWADRTYDAERSIVIHAGSGKELEAVSTYCAKTHSPLIELATGSDIDSSPHAFPVVLCPNTNILMLKFMSMMERSGHLFRNHQIKLTESHQANKTSVPGTAVSIARSLGLNDGDIRSLRSKDDQREDLQIPEAHLDRHAYHQIVIEDGGCRVILETRVYGESPYADGVSRIVEAVSTRKLEDRLYPIAEFVDNGWL